MKILLIDAFNMIHRARHGHDHGDHGVTYTFFRSIRSEVEKHKPDSVFLVSEGKPVKRLIENADYKSTRVPIVDDSFHRQKRDIFELCKLLPIFHAKHPDHECDDVLAHIATSMFPSDDVVICSTDTDFIQIVDSRVNLWNPIKKNFVEPFENYAVWKALRGDKSDNIPGVKGIGDVTATKLSRDQDKLKNFLESDQQKRIDFESSLRQVLFEVVDQSNIQFSINVYDSEKLIKEFSDRNFNSLLEKSWKKWNQTWVDLEVKCNKHRSRMSNLNCLEKII